MKKRVFALAAHPDDMEIGMAGTALLLAKAGYEIHFMHVARVEVAAAWSWMLRRSPGFAEKRR